MQKNIYILLIAILLAIFSSCNKEEFAALSSDKLEFSIDTIQFDTIFTEKGSITRYFKIFNPHKGIVKIDEIYVSQQESLEYFINVNGVSSTHIKNIEIEPGDSLFVFVQAKLKENQRDTAIQHLDSLVFKYNTTSSNIILSAWGQDVNNIKGATISTVTFTANKPYVIYDSLVVKEGETLTIEEGTKIYLHYNANIIVHGSLQIQGSKENRVILTSDRLEPAYQTLPGQWGSIIFTNSSRNNSINYAIIKNGINGILAQGTSTDMINFTISNSQIFNMSSSIIFAKNADINMFNNVFANCNNYIFAFQGGKYNCIHNTISNDGTLGSRNIESSIFVSDYSLSDNSQIPLQQAYFYNSIIVGQISNEISIASLNNTPLECKFDYCLLKDTYYPVDSIYYGKNNYYNNTKNLFFNKSNTNFSLDTLSQAQNEGLLNYANSVTTDINGNSRIADSKPDIGAYEYFYEEK